MIHAAASWTDVARSSRCSIHASQKYATLLLFLRIGRDCKSDEMYVDVVAITSQQISINVWLRTEVGL